MNINSILERKLVEINRSLEKAVSTKDFSKLYAQRASVLLEIQRSISK